MAPEGTLRNQLSAKATDAEKKCFIACYFFLQNLSLEGLWEDDGLFFFFFFFFKGRTTKLLSLRVVN